MYRFTAELWLYPGDAPWHFLTLPPNLADEVSDVHDEDRRGFGSLAVEVTVGATTWTTSISPDTTSGSYVLPVKKAVRTSERLTKGDRVEVSFRVVARMSHRGPPEARDVS